MERSPSRLASLVLPWALYGAIVAACSGSDDEPFGAPTHAPHVRTFAALDASVSPISSSTGGGSGTGGQTGLCSATFCPAMGAGAGCCLPDGSCGIDFGLGCMAAPKDAGTPVTPPTVACAKDGDCGAGKVCCATTQGGQITNFTCQTTCGATDIAVHCAVPGDCSTGQQCCGTYANNAYTSIDCADTCTGGGNGSYVLCASATDCGDGGGVCQNSVLLMNNYKVCR